MEIPFLVIYVILLSYMAFASWAIARLEGWSTQDGLYFVMMSVLTIGFGDVIPSGDNHVLPVLFIILAGLVVTTTCIDVVGAYYIDRLHFFGRRPAVADDPLAWLKAVQQRRIEAMKREAMRRLFETISALNRLNVEGMGLNLNKGMMINNNAPMEQAAPALSLINAEAIRRQIEENRESGRKKLAEISQQGEFAW